MHCLLTRGCLILVITGSILHASAACQAGSPVLVGRRPVSGRDVSFDDVDHGAWDTLLRKYVDSDGNVNYTSWKASAADQRALDEYLNQLSMGAPTKPASREGRLAFWINAYNAVTIKGILREYPTTSIRNHTARLVGYNIWKDLQLLVAGKPYSLEAIEHEVLRKMDEPRIHFAIVCASIGCPRLLNEAYVADRLDEQLASNTRAFLADPTKFRFEASQRVFHLSKIMEWYGDDFGASHAEQLKSLSSYMPTDEARRLAAAGEGRVSFLEYDWNLNDQATRRTASRGRGGR
jgi:hypothetical protein